MGLRFRKSIKVAKGVRVNLGLKGVSVSFGKKGLRHSIHSSGRQTTSVGLPGTGMSYVKTHSAKKTKGLFASLAGIFSGEDKGKSGESKLLKAEDPLKENQEALAEYEKAISAIKDIHKSCDQYIDWQEISKLSPPKEKDAYENWARLNSFSKKILEGDIDAYLQVIDEMKPFDDLLDYGSEFECGTDNSAIMEIEFNVKSNEVIPTYEVGLTKTGKLSKKDLSKTRYYDIVQDYVASTSIRVARDIFALLPVKIVFVHAVDTRLNTTTGHMEEEVILSVRFDRDKMEKINFAKVDPSDALENFSYNMDFLKTKGFRRVERINEI